MINKVKSLTPEVYYVIVERGTEPPHTGLFNLTESKGTYLCRQCGKALFRSDHKFISACGWPSFDDEVPTAIERLRDLDGQRIEIRCQRCQGHLGHVFEGEHLTVKNLRHCVNSLSIDFVSSESVLDTEEIIVAGGCFWGLEYHLAQEHGVLLAESGYIGGHLPYPTYERICRSDTGYVEAVRLIFDLEKTNIDTLYKAFFEWHDPTQRDGQGPDKGSQYLSKIFVYSVEQEQSACALIRDLEKQGLDVATEISPIQVFWKAEEEHQDYLVKNPDGYCSHQRVKRF